jgi:hypothetical protein
MSYWCRLSNYNGIGSVEFQSFAAIVAFLRKSAFASNTVYPRTVASFQKRPGLLNRQTDRFLAKDMLSRFGSFDRPWDMKMIGQGL